LIDAAAAGDFAKPMYAVLPGFDFVPVPVQLQKNFLGQFLSHRVVLQEVVRHAVNHGLVLVNRGLKRATSIRFRNGLGNADLLGQTSDH